MVTVIRGVFSLNSENREGESVKRKDKECY